MCAMHPLQKNHGLLQQHLCFSLFTNANTSFTLLTSGRGVGFCAPPSPRAKVINHYRVMMFIRNTKVEVYYRPCKIREKIIKSSKQLQSKGIVSRHWGKTSPACIPLIYERCFLTQPHHQKCYVLSRVTMAVEVLVTSTIPLKHLLFFPFLQSILP